MSNFLWHARCTSAGCKAITSARSKITSAACFLGRVMLSPEIYIMRTHIDTLIHIYAHVQRLCADMCMHARSHTLLLPVPFACVHVRHGRDKNELTEIEIHSMHLREVPGYLLLMCVQQM